MVLRSVKISAIFLAWVLFIIHSFVPHHHVEELAELFSPGGVVASHEHHGAHASNHGDGLPYLNHSVEFGSRLIKTDPIVLQLDKHIGPTDIYLPATGITVPNEAPRFSVVKAPFTCVACQTLVFRLSSPPLPGRAPPALS